MKTGIDWFRRPTDTDPGTLNACYNALDRHVIRGRADDVALVDLETGKPITYARLLTQAAAFGGALKALGVAPGDPVGWSLGLSPHGIVALMGCLRIGAVPLLGSMGEIHDSAARVVVVGHAVHLPHFPAAEGRTLVAAAGDEGVEDREDVVSWSILMQAGGSQPAACEELPADALLWTNPSTGRETTMADLQALADDPSTYVGPPSSVLAAFLQGDQWSEDLL